MSFPVELTSMLTGASVHQLRRWRATKLLIPEVQEMRPPLYSFRDVVALRTVMRLRAETSLQRIRGAFRRLPEYDLTSHLSQYKFATRGKSIAVWTDEGWMDLVNNPGQYELHTLEDIYQPFTTKTGGQVVSFIHPRPNLEIDPRRGGGWPLVAGTRVTYDVVAQAIDGQTVTVDNISEFYPGVSREGAIDAIDFSVAVIARRKRAA